MGGRSLIFPEIIPNGNSNWKEGDNDFQLRTQTRLDAVNVLDSFVSQKEENSRASDGRWERNVRSDRMSCELMLVCPASCPCGGVCNRAGRRSVPAPNSPGPTMVQEPRCSRCHCRCSGLFLVGNTFSKERLPIPLLEISSSHLSRLVWPDLLRRKNNRALSSSLALLALLSVGFGKPFFKFYLASAPIS